MENSREQWVTKRAYELWEEAGRPEGQDSEHWHQASLEWEAGKGKTDELDDPWEEEI